MVLGLLVFLDTVSTPSVLDHRTTTTSTSTAGAIAGRTVTIHHNNNNNNHPVLFLMQTCDFIYRVKTLSYTIPLLTNTRQVDPKMLFCPCRQQQRRRLYRRRTSIVGHTGRSPQAVSHAKSNMNSMLSTKKSWVAVVVVVMVGTLS